ncbi:hypothetical protein PG997_008945 [Apiospora hydei]|uniref:Uncharacterized protein n=1 Tax=Apiospora hydei TaxID=1337664 RepID=A0ABR1WDN5_9PEZI
MARRIRRAAAPAARRGAPIRGAHAAPSPRQVGDGAAPPKSPMNCAASQAATQPQGYAARGPSGTGRAASRRRAGRTGAGCPPPFGGSRRSTVSVTP